MEDIKYIYYEIYSIVDSDGNKIVEEKFQNINILKLKPITNSSGFWGFTNVTERKSKNEFVWLHQNWINLEKYKLGHSLKNKEINKCLEYLNIKLRKEKLEKIGK